MLRLRDHFGNRPASRDGFRLLRALGNAQAFMQHAPSLCGRHRGTVMSIFAVNYLCREVLRDHAFRAAMKADPAKALAPLDLTDDERKALIAGDVGTLYRMGVNGFLMGYLARFEVCGLNVEIYNQRMRAVKVDEVGAPV
jgi:hypothetical protein